MISKLKVGPTQNINQATYVFEVVLMRAWLQENKVQGQTLGRWKSPRSVLYLKPIGT